jgi:hypothetical protein
LGHARKDVPIDDCLGRSEDWLNETNSCESVHCVRSYQIQLIVDESERQQFAVVVTEEHQTVTYHRPFTESTGHVATMTDSVLGSR